MTYGELCVGDIIKKRQGNTNHRVSTVIERREDCVIMRCECGCEDVFDLDQGIAPYCRVYSTVKLDEEW
jgi:hypothetical protein